MGIYGLFFLLLLLFFLLFFVFLTIWDKIKLKKLRRNYNEAEDKSRRGDKPIAIDIGAAGGIGEAEPIFKGADELARRDLLQGISSGGAGEDVPVPIADTGDIGEEERKRKRSEFLSQRMKEYWANKKKKAL